MASHPEPSTSLLGVLGRLMWMFIGPLTLLVLTFTIVRTGQSWLTGVDIAYLIILGCMLLGRWLEFQGGNPQTATGEPASQAHLRRYLLVASLTGLAVWAAANVVGLYLLSS
jgi:hypothetical protein